MIATTDLLNLKDFKLPHIQGLRDNIGFGTVVDTSHNEGSLTISEFAEDLALPLQLRKGLEFNASMNLDNISVSGKIFINSGNSKIPFGNPQGACLEVTVTAMHENSQSIVTFPYSETVTESFPLKSGMTITLMSIRDGANNFYWRLKDIEYNGTKLVAKDADASIYYTKKRWLHFVPEASSSTSDTNRKSLKILKGTYLRLDGDTFRKWLCCTDDKIFDLSADIEAEGTKKNGSDFSVYLVENSSFVNNTDDLVTLKASLIQETTKTQNGSTIYPTIREAVAPANSKFIGRFHTLCETVGTITPTIPVGASSGVTAGTLITVVPYTKEEDEDFYNLYTIPVKSVAVNANTYDTVTLNYHSLQDYQSGDILPESIWCLSFWPKTTIMDGMVFNKYYGRADDIYLYSGNGFLARSVYHDNSGEKVLPTSNRIYYNMQEDIRMVGKNLLTDKEFTALALGSNEKTSVKGGNKTTTGGNIDTANRRMISFVGAEDCCGHLYQILDEVSPSGGSAFSSSDGKGDFGQEYGVPFVLIAGGSWGVGSACGSRCRVSNDSRSGADSDAGARGSGAIADIVND